MDYFTTIIGPYVLSYWGCLHCRNERFAQLLKKSLPVKIVENKYMKSFFLGDRIYREDGPSMEYSNGDKEWWVNGKRNR
jgi:hypothetical protein